MSLQTVNVYFLKKINYDTYYTLKKNGLYQLAKFVVKENSSHHRNDPSYEESFFKDVEEVYSEDLLLYDTSNFYVATFKKKIIGSVKITLWDQQTTLPMEKLFGIRRRDLPFADKLIWQVGRLAISKTGNPIGINLLKQLLTLAIYSICQHADSVMIAECDKKLLRGLKLMGIKTETLGKGIEYLGSETIPAYATYEWLNVFLHNNSYLEEVRKIAAQGLKKRRVGRITTYFDPQSNRSTVVDEL